MSTTGSTVDEVATDGSENAVEAQSGAEPEAGDAQGTSRGAQQTGGLGRTDGQEQTQGTESDAGLIDQGEESAAADPTAPPAPLTLNIILALPKPWASIMECLSVKDKLRLAESHRPIHQKMWPPPPADPNPDVFKSVTASDFSSSLDACGYGTNFDDRKAEAFIDFLDATQNVLQELYLPSKLLTHMTAPLLATFPALRIKKFEVRVKEWEALPVLSTEIIPRIPSVENLVLDCSYEDMYNSDADDNSDAGHNSDADGNSDADTDDSDSDNEDDDPQHVARSNLLADVLTAIGVNCPNIQRPDFTSWGAVNSDIGAPAEIALVEQLLSRLQFLSAIDLTGTDLSTDCIRSVLALPNIRANLGEFRGDLFISEDLIGLRHCGNLRFLDRYVDSNPSNPLDITQSFNGLCNLNHLHLMSNSSANDSGLMEILGDLSRSLTHLSLTFSGIYNDRDNAVKRAISSNPRLQVLALTDYEGELDDSSLTALGTLSDLRVIAVRRQRTGFLHHLTPANHPDLRLVIIKSTTAVDETACTVFHQLFGNQAALAVRSYTNPWGSFKWFTDRPLPLPDHLSDRDRVDATVNMSCPSSACCISHWSM